MNVIVAGVAMDSGPLGIHGNGWTAVAALSIVGLVLMLGALRSARRAPVYVVRDIGRRR